MIPQPAGKHQDERVHGVGARFEIRGVHEGSASGAVKMLAVGMPRLLSKIVNLYTWPLHGVHFNTGHWMASEFSEAFQWRSIQDRANQLRRMPLLGSRVNSGFAHAPDNRGRGCTRCRA